MDFLALYLTARLLHLTVKPMKLCLSASIGALYSLAAAILNEYLTSAAGRVAYIVSGGICVYIMACISYSKRPREATKAGITFVAVSVGIGGTMTALYSALSALIFGSGTGPPDISPSTSPLTFAVLALISGAVSLVYGKLRDSTVSKRKINVTVTLFGHAHTLTLLCDSGNLLREPIGGKRVIIVGSEVLADGLPPGLQEAAKHPLDTVDLPDHAARKLRLIPANTVMGSGMMLGIVPDSIRVSDHEIDAVIAIDPGNRSFGECDGVIPAALLSV